MKILISTSSFDVGSSQPLQALKARGHEIVSNPHGRRLTEGEISVLLGSGVNGLIAGVEPLTRSVLAGASQLKVISRCGTGLDNVDLEAARELGLLVFNTPNAPSIAVAELTIGLMLGVLRRLCEADRAIRQGAWQPLTGKLLCGKTVGLVGYGRIGKKVAHLLAGFECRVLAHDAAPSREGAGVEHCGLDELLAMADIVSLHVPYSPQTHHLIDAGNIQRMKRGAILVNASRGGLVDERALLEGLESGHLSGAALDTFEIEPYRGPLAALPQVLLTAHMGSYAAEARSQMEQECVVNLVRGLGVCGMLERETASALTTGRT